MKKSILIPLISIVAAEPLVNARVVVPVDRYAPQANVLPLRSNVPAVCVNEYAASVEFGPAQLSVSWNTFEPEEFIIIG